MKSLTGMADLFCLVSFKLFIIPEHSSSETGERKKEEEALNEMKLKGSRLLAGSELSKLIAI